MHWVGRNAGALVCLSVCLLLRHQLPTVTGVFWCSSQEKVLGAICSGMQSCSVARRAGTEPHSCPQRSPVADAFLGRELPLGTCTPNIQPNHHLMTTFFCKEKFAYQQLWGTVHLCSTAVINRTQSAVSSPRPKVLPWQYLVSIQCFCAGKIFRIYFQLQIFIFKVFSEPAELKFLKIMYTEEK